jgi:FtsH-binding integral membrane protein
MVDFNQMSAQNTQATAGYDVGLREHMLGVYRNLALGLGLSAVTAFLTLSIPALTQMIHNSPLGLVVQLAPLGILFFLMFKMNSISSSGIKTLYWVFCGLKGMALSYVALVYTGESVVRALGLTAAIFGAVSLYGYSTKRDLTSIGFFLMTGVFAIFAAMVVSWIVSMFGVDTSMFQFILFTGMALLVIGLTAYETQQLKAQYYQLSGEARDKAAMMTTLNLYINVIIIFQWILSIMGNQR